MSILQYTIYKCDVQNRQFTIYKYNVQHVHCTACQSTRSAGVWSEGKRFWEFVIMLWLRPMWWCFYTVMTVMMSKIAEQTPQCGAVCKPTRLKPPSWVSGSLKRRKTFWEVRFEKAPTDGAMLLLQKTRRNNMKQSFIRCKCFLLSSHVGIDHL